MKTSQPPASHYLPSCFLPSDLANHHHHRAHAHKPPTETIHYVISLANQVSPPPPTLVDNPLSTLALAPLKLVPHQTYLRKAKTFKKEPWSNVT